MTSNHITTRTTVQFSSVQLSLFNSTNQLQVQETYWIWNRS